jgi:uncharacterized protein
MEDGALQRLTESECVAMLGRVDVARIALSRHALPVIEPVHYRLEGDVLLLTVDHPESIASAARERHVVCLEVDGLHPGGDARWVVQVTGPLRTDGEVQQLDLSTAMIAGDLRPLRLRTAHGQLEP